MGFRFSARQVEHLCDSVRAMVEEVRVHERAIMDLAINKSGMPRTHFIKTFPATRAARNGSPRNWPPARPMPRC
jgi:RNA polymerase primary sigma factor